MLDVDGAAAVEDLRAELARAKEQAKRSDAAASKAAEELEAERAAHCRSREEMDEMAVKLKDATDRYEVLERERRAGQEDLKNATTEGCPFCNEGYKGGAASGRRHCGWKALSAA